MEFFKASCFVGSWDVWQMLEGRRNAISRFLPRVKNHRHLATLHENDVTIESDRTLHPNQQWRWELIKDDCKKVKLSLCLIKHYAMKAYGGVGA
jgi:hypothetical protein